MKVNQKLAQGVQVRNWSAFLQSCLRDAEHALTWEEGRHAGRLEREEKCKGKGKGKGGKGQQGKRY